MSRQHQQTVAWPIRKERLLNYNAFDTDAENADDTTVTSFSDEGAQSNLRQQDLYATHNNHAEDDQRSINGNESHYADGETDDGREGPIDDQEHDLLYTLQHGLGEDGILPRSQSYPSTSFPDGDDEEEEGEQGGYAGHEQYESQSPRQNHHIPYPTPQEHLRPSHPYVAQDMFHQLRHAAPKKNISDTSLPVRSGAIHSEIPRPRGAKPVQQTQQEHHHTLPPPSAQPQLKDTQSTRPARRPSTISNAETINEHNFLTSRPSTAQKAPLSPSDASSEPIQDYEDERLFKMSYSDLDKESFDHDPRADSTKNSFSHLTNSPLEERLRSAFRELRPEDQADFFASLTINEWEDAGDWFLEQFGDLLGRFKEARRRRRDVARKFEDEIRKRNDAVGRKRQCVEKEVGRIKGQGQRLLPDTPSRRRAATPAFTPGR
ncbi:hypothetical protein SLS55_007964 [Diplodia seriata]|uniref:Extracellular mutant protein 11 C-terminal domain-containing protein n=1 Tax=Diplodia seriata TaxID=420778 RepID=A0A1S8BI55_9PEZI|nr:hypothetical protein BK809_0007278 [Diplodia seriata]